MTETTGGKTGTADMSDLARMASCSNALLADALDMLAMRLDGASKHGGDADFALLVGLSRRLLGLDDLGASALLGVSRPTVGRWTRGVSSPHALTRRAVYGVLASKARAQAGARRGLGDA